MPDEDLTPREAEQLAAVQVITDLPAEEIDGWAVVVSKPSGTFLIVSDLCCHPHTVGMLAHAVAIQMDDIASLYHIEHD